MERGVQLLKRIITASLTLGALVVVVHPGYRGAVVALGRGQPQASAIWESNRDYYREVEYPREASDEAAQ
jgi:sugar phosphate isomerase/epimerase